MNYLDYYELAQEPFSNAPVSRFYFNSPQHSQALVRLTHLCSQMKGLGILIGDIGAGKTTLARRLLDSLPENEYEAALLVIIHSGVTASWMPFTPGAVQSVHRFSNGTPRVINTLCDNALFEGYVARVPMIDEQMIERVARELALDGASAAANPAPPRRPVSVPPPAAAEQGKPIDLGEIARYLAGLAKPS